MKHVYIIFKNDGFGRYRIHDIFEKKREAEKECKKMNEEDATMIYEVEEWEVK